MLLGIWVLRWVVQPVKPGSDINVILQVHQARTVDLAASLRSASALGQSPSPQTLTYVALHMETIFAWLGFAVQLLGMAYIRSC
jgi:hypothetical protein